MYQPRWSSAKHREKQGQSCKASERIMLEPIRLRFKDNGCGCLNSPHIFRQADANVDKRAATVTRDDRWKVSGILGAEHAYQTLAVSIITYVAEARLGPCRFE